MPAKPTKRIANVVLVETPAAYQLTIGKQKATVDKQTGWLTEWTSGATPLLRAPLITNFWRAATDNDIRGWRTATTLKQWHQHQWDKVTVQLGEQNDKQVVIASDLTDVQGTHCRLQYTFFDSGVIGVDYTIHLSAEAVEPLRIGLQMEVNGAFGQVTYYGRGAWENYSDRCRAAEVGLYQAPVEKMIWEYIQPQKNGNRTDVRWWEMRQKSGIGMRVTGEQPLSMSVSPYTMQNLEEATHTYELKKNGNLTLNIDHRQAGVGGNNTWDINARPLAAYRLLENEHM